MEIKKVHLIFFSLIVIIALFSSTTAVDVDIDDGWHPLNQIARTLTDLTSVDENSNGIIDNAETAGACSSDDICEIKNATISGNVTITGLVNCDTVDTDPNGNLRCGRDEIWDNGFDIHFPDGVWGATPIRKELGNSCPTKCYTVSSGKILYITSVYNQYTAELGTETPTLNIPFNDFDNIHIDPAQLINFPSPLPVAGGTQISCGGCPPSENYPLIIYGYEVTQVSATAVRVETYSGGICPSGPGCYQVPAGKTLYIVAIKNKSNTDQYLQFPAGDLDNIKMPGYGVAPQAGSTIVAGLIKFDIPLPVPGGTNIKGGSSENYPLVIYGYLR